MRLPTQRICGGLQLGVQWRRDDLGACGLGRLAQRVPHDLFQPGKSCGTTHILHVSGNEVKKYSALDMSHDQGGRVRCQVAKVSKYIDSVTETRLSSGQTARHAREGRCGDAEVQAAVGDAAERQKVLVVHRPANHIVATPERRAEFMIATSWFRMPMGRFMLEDVLERRGAVVN